MNIKILKLKNGENLLGSIVESGDILTIDRPMAMAFTPQGIANYDWLAVCKEPKTAQISRNDLLCAPLTPSNEVLDIYRQWTAAEAGLVIPGGGLRI